MASMTPLGFLRQVRSGIEDGEGARYGDLSSAMADSIQCLLEGIAESEVAARIGVGFHERSDARQDYRNGVRYRQVQTAYTTLTLRVPRLRGQGYVPSFVERGHRALSEVEAWVSRGFLSGLSRIDIIRYMESTCGVRPSEDVLRRVQADLDVHAKAFKERSLVDAYDYLFLDAAWVKDIVGAGAGRICVLTAVGVTPGGQKQVLGFERGKQESESSWRGFLMRLKERGLRAADLKLVISDAHRGILAAVPEVLGDVAHQLCWAHRVRNVRASVAKSDQKAVVLGLRAIYQAQNTQVARAGWVVFRDKWLPIYPTMIAHLEAELRYLLAFLEMPVAHQRYVRTTNPIERVFLDLRRRRFGCGAFANRLACDRVLYAVYRLLNELWKDKDIWQKRRLALAAQS